MNEFRRALRLEHLEDRCLMAFSPTPVEQELLQLLNRFRSDPQNEFSRLISSAAPIAAFDAEVDREVKAARVDGNLLRSEFQALSARQPMAWNEQIYNIAAAHNASMAAQGQQFHHTSGTLPTLMQNAGVPIEPPSVGENVYGFGKSALHIHAAYVIDWANANDPTAVGGMQNPRGHRNTIMNTNYNQVGSAIQTYGGSVAGFGSLINTQDFAKVSSSQKMAVGSLFEDKNLSRWYEAGEGIGSVSIEFVGAAGTFSTTTMAAGGYQVVLPAGTYTGTARGGSLAHSVSIPNIVVNSDNVWVNFIYDPNAIAPDSSESNDSTGAATQLTGRDQSLSSLTIHSGDVDFFKFVPISNGSGTVTMSLDNTRGNLDFQILNASGTVIATSATSTNTETATINVTRGQTYFVRVFPAGNIANRYSMQLDLPEPMAPTVNPDSSLTTTGSAAIQINILANDTDPDGTASTLAPVMVSSGTGQFVVTSSKQVEFTPAANFVGIDRASYRATDDQGLVSNAASIEVVVVDFTRNTPWTNPRRSLDVNDDGIISPLDALLIINEINARGFRDLPTTLAAASGFVGFLDTTGTTGSTVNFIEPLDVLLVINHLNGASGEGELLEPGSVEFAHDAALMQIFFPTEEQRKKKL